MKAQAVIIQMENEFIHTEHSVICENCDSTDEDNFGDSLDAAKAFYESGWRIFNDALLCPKCFKNRNK